jgi:tRNA (pseudouridine54-N1)-methyltransferase
LAVRKFVIRAHDLPTEFGFTLDNLPGNGRADLISRTVGSALLTSHGIRDDTTVYISARETAIKLEGSELGGLNPDERSIAGVIQKAVNVYSEEWKDSTPGVQSARKSFQELIEDFDDCVIQLGSEGIPAVEFEPPENPVFILSDHRDFNEEEIGLLEETEVISLSPVELQSDQAVAVANNWLDTRGFEEF